MQRVDGFYLYQVGSRIHPLSDLEADDTTYAQARFPVYVAEAAIGPLIANSVFRLRTSVQTGQNLLTAVRELKAKLEAKDADPEKLLDWFDLYGIKNGLTAFEAVLGAELSLSPLYVVTQKAGFDMPLLIENGVACFPQEKDLHRNPLIHPEHSIESMDEAIALMNGVHNVMVHMLRGIPVTAPTNVIPAGAVAPPTVNP